MGILESIWTVSGASGGGAIDWEASTEAAKASTDPGELSLSEGEKQAYATDVQAARDAVLEVTNGSFEVPESVQIFDRHHWIEANVDTFERIMTPVAEHMDVVPSAARKINTGTMSVMLAFLGRNVLGQYDPVLLADGEHELYFVHPNIVRVGELLDVPMARFRRWIAFHEVTHAAEFGAAPWLSAYLESRVEETVENLAGGQIDREAFKELDAVMTAVEGYAELLMDHAFDRPHQDLRDALERRRRNRGPIAKVIQRLLGLGMKRRQYERGRTFFEAIEDARGIESTHAVWEAPEKLPSSEELDAPGQWLSRVDP